MPAAVKLITETDYNDPAIRLYSVTLYKGFGSTSRRLNGPQDHWSTPEQLANWLLAEIRAGNESMVDHGAPWGSPGYTYTTHVREPRVRAIGEDAAREELIAALER